MQGSRVVGGRTNRLASAPRDSTALWSRPREGSRKGVAELSLAGLYDINMIYHALHPVPTLGLRYHCDRCPGLDLIVPRIFLPMPARLRAFSGMGCGDAPPRNAIGNKVPVTTDRRIINKSSICRHIRLLLHGTEQGAATRPPSTERSIHAERTAPLWLVGPRYADAGFSRSPRQADPPPEQAPRL
jgi:hypothetical protein